MAEKVQERLEAMLPELEDLKNKNIFNEQEINSIIKKRTQLEYAISRRIAKKGDYLRYLEYEMNLEKLRKKRRARLPKNSKISLSDYAGQRRIFTLFERSLMKFKGDVKLWLQYIDFAHEQQSNRTLAKAYAKAIRLLPDNEMLWIQAANYEFKDNLNMEAARILFQRGIRLNPNNFSLYLEYFRLELKYIEKIKLRKKILLKETEEEQKKDTIQLELLENEARQDDLPLIDGVITNISDEDAFITGAIPKVIYNSAISKFPTDFNLRVRFLDILNLFSPLETLQGFIYESILNDFKEDSKAYDLTFKRSLINLEPDSVNYINEVSNCINKYESILKERDTPEMLTLFVNFLFENYQKANEKNMKTFFGLKLQKVLKQAFTKARKEDFKLPKEFYNVYINFIEDFIKSDKLLSQVCIHATEAHPTIVEFWLRRIQTIQEKSIHRIKATLYEAIENNLTSRELWNQYLDISIQVLDLEPKQYEEEDNNNLNFDSQESLFLSSLYKLESLLVDNEEQFEERKLCRELIHKNMLIWAYKSHNIEYVREFAKKISVKISLSTTFYKEWIKLELEDYSNNIHGDKQEPKDEEMYNSFRGLFDKRKHLVATDKIEFIKKLYETMIRLEQNNIESWLEYLAFLYNTAPQHHASQMLLRAKASLDKATYSALEGEFKSFIQMKNKLQE